MSRTNTNKKKSNIKRRKNNNIVLIGPIGTGKSTIGKILSKKLELPHAPLDSVRFDYYREIGYDDEFAKFLQKNFGFWTLYLYWKEFGCHAIKRILEENNNSVIDFGGGHSVYENENQLNRVKNCLKENIVFLLLPSEDIDESFEILCKRREIQKDEKDLNFHLLKHKSNKELADFTVYTKNKTPDETCEEIVSAIKNMTV